MKYAIVVISEKLEIRNSNLADILEQEEDYILREDSKFIGCSGIDKYIKINIKKQKPKFLNWYDNINYINMWNSKEEAELFLNELLNKAYKNYKTKNDPFFHLEKTKGDWKNYMFKVVNISNHIKASSI